jgi:hypothetical protein
MKKQKNPRGVAARYTGPFTCDTASVDRNEIYVISNGPDGTYLVKALPALNPPDGPRL